MGGNACKACNVTHLSIMKSHRLKEYRNSYREWRKHPVEYKYTGEKHRCDCCGEEHEGNFCPLCGQKATQGPVTWKSVWAGVMEIWGMHSRSLPYTAWQLLFRPGHLMRDYVTGKRQVSFPPVKMLVLMGVIVYFIGHWVAPKEYTHDIDKISSTGAMYYLEYAWQWLLHHSEWLSLAIGSVLILPTWFVFRHAPLLKRHTLPQGFFIQVFLANQGLVIELFFLLIGLLLFFVPQDDIVLGIQFCVLLMYLVIDYKQLFGYNWWGTIWRLMMMFIVTIFVVGLIGDTVDTLMSVTGSSALNTADSNLIMRAIFRLSVMLVFCSYLLYILLYSINTINRKTWLERGKWKAWRVPIILTGIIVVAPILIAIISFLIK